MVLVTGATGFIGNHVARFLAARGECLRLFVRPSSDRTVVAGLDAEVVVGDLRDAASVARAISACVTVFHVAAEYRLWCRDPRQMYETNVEGTRNVLEAALQAGVERVVHTSSIGTIAPNQDGSPVTEDSPSSLEMMTGHYKRSKYLAEREAELYAGHGLNVVIVNPTAPIGEGDFQPTPTGQIIKDFLEGRMPAYVNTGLNLVDVRDVARGHWQAAQRGCPGERYILGSENLALRQILALAGAASERQAPRLRLPYFAAWVAGACSTGWAHVAGTPPRVPLDGVRMSRRAMFADCSKARNDLGFDPAPIQPALARAVDWFQRTSS
ncbi:MAG: NAD-dependent epimerase/dehydratase family protein [Bryobacterales bacterium]|nr:NAD-dependent epimerase/dehydratase family protein [Bryobacterales bacterium]MDE0621645.1 NAD-dependent epimerase/dehydratase family protein [Bryobacterales bacterium]